MIVCKFPDGNEGELRHVTVDTLVLKDGQILLVKRTAKLIEGGKWGLIGGYMDRDENVFEAAAREVYEETGWEIEDMKFIKLNDTPSRPNEDTQNVSFVFIAKGIKQTGTPDWESDEIRWFDLDNIPEDSMMAFDHADDIKYYKQLMSENKPFPSLV
jgi:8-oxo-dGTP diphosphatase